MFANKGKKCQNGSKKVPKHIFSRGRGNLLTFGRARIPKCSTGIDPLHFYERGPHSDTGIKAKGCKGISLASATLNKVNHNMRKS
jgi:hypothetical protein